MTTQPIKTPTWTVDDDAYLLLTMDTLDAPQQARALGRTFYAVQARRLVLQALRAAPAVPTTRQAGGFAAVLEVLQEHPNASIGEVAAAVGVSYGHAAVYLSALVKRGQAHRVGVGRYAVKEA